MLLLQTLCLQAIAGSGAVFRDIGYCISTANTASNNEKSNKNLQHKSTV